MLPLKIIQNRLHASKTIIECVFFLIVSVLDFFYERKRHTKCVVTTDNMNPIHPQFPPSHQP